ncbi:STAS domain-containing protein [Herpetosiphon llansteffanensis]|uniref:STAS domain-containing protein n=1 Tax=Herpetosiphon llansteffanensis TaxID=2094568 RepID=UPI0013DEF8D7|nr:STAS domain-containing protein [Herpetosiphon llansteffanensis]
MAKTTAAPRQIEDLLQTSNEQRIKLFSLVEGLALFAVMLILLFAGNGQQLQIGLSICGIAGTMLAITFAMRRSRYVEWLIYLNLASITLMLSLTGPIIGEVDGSVWVLFQVPPLIATIVLNTSRATTIICIASMIILSLVIGSEFTGIIPIKFLVPKSALLINFFCQLLVLAVIAVTVRLLVGRAKRAFAVVAQTEAKLEQQLAKERELALQREQLNAQLSQSLAEISQRDSQIQAEQAAQAALRAQLRQLSLPVIPVLKHTVVMPLVGDLLATSSEGIEETLLAGASYHRAKIAILDVTGVPTIDTELGRRLMQATAAARLLGVQTIIAGIRPDVAQTLVSLGIDFRSVVTVASLQDGVAIAIKRLGMG